MKKVLLAGSALLAALSLVSAAQAADVSVAPSYDWTGFYVGANAGVAWGNSSLDTSYTVDGLVRAPNARLYDLNNSIDGDSAGFTGGGILGYNYQIDQIVLGVEADINYLGLSNSGRRTGTLQHPDPAPVIDINSRGSVEADWFGTIRGRLGYAIDNVLIYGTGGAAYGSVSSNAKVTASYDGTELATWKGSNDETKWGWTLGGGMEYGVDNWSLGLEYLYVDLGSDSFRDTTDLVKHPGDFTLKGNADYAFSTVRATFKHRFQ